MFRSVQSVPLEKVDVLDGAITSEEIIDVATQSNVSQKEHTVEEIMAMLEKEDQNVEGRDVHPNVGMFENLK